MTRKLTIFALPLLLASSLSATTWQFSFSGGRPNTFSTSGSGSFSYDGNPSAVALSDLTNFQLNYVFDDLSYDPANSVTTVDWQGVYSDDLSNLTDFSLTVDTFSQTVSSLSASDVVGAFDSSLPQEFNIFTTSGSVAFSTAAFVWAPVTITDPPDTAPEPASIALFGAGLTGVFLLRRPRHNPA